ncbi:LacI family DNA-binding transcriptional regulator [Pseudotabrizicola sp.]|uniref:LacI family DNA-binding transcriptional regulator n=1 Tax=Pseudotabrizicola sp. TaxID=2939647 RepID=UPI002720F724|nr:LacI family DNA-binding transcriptional regulator [Pseudotabrizicola sp.]MDO8881774.1 LacI family DNA-binding transcriptional regulator [Pseudotabrizicola sp.]
MHRPTVKDLAEAANVSVATVNRVLAGTASVREATRKRIEIAAAQIGFYGLGSIQARNTAARPKLKFGILLLQPHRHFYQAVATALHDAAARFTSAEISLEVEFLEDLSPQNTAQKAIALAQRCDAIALTSAVHPLVIQAVETIQASNKPVFALISQLSATGQVHYIGLDNWKVGRTSAWAMSKICKRAGKVGILLGNHRYRNQEMNEAGFRSYFREHAPDFALLEPIQTFEAGSVAEEMTERLLHDHPDLVGLYVSGGGISGVLAALSDPSRPPDLVVVGYDLMAQTKAGLLDGRLTFVISHPLAELAEKAISSMVRSVAAPSETTVFTSIVPFEIYTSENV